MLLCILQFPFRARTHLTHVAIDPPPKKTFEAEGPCLERALTKCLSEREAALRRCQLCAIEQRSRHGGFPKVCCRTCTMALQKHFVSPGAPGVI
jgi:hypothetical protein